MIRKIFKMVIYIYIYLNFSVWLLICDDNGMISSVKT